ncbi:MAG: prepilin-type N-terminal cleavage/methylation domain-containing protein [Clostridiaceae bacterium]|nr:prepilin-type N-terminal cleavage/methylation domain-containing protein [Clostridiaceae bacterium]
MGRKWTLKRLKPKVFINNKGFSLVEAVVAIAVIGIVSVAVSSLFFSMSRVSKFSEQQMKRNAVIKVIKENVGNAVRKNTVIYGTASMAPNTVGEEITELPVKDLSGQEYPEYAFNLKFAGYTENNVRQYKAALISKYGGANTFEFLFEIYH